MKGLEGFKSEDNRREEKREEISKKVRSLIAAGLLTVNSATEGANYSEQAMELGELNELGHLISEIETGENTSISGKIAERLRDVSLYHPNEVALVLVKEGGVLSLGQFDEGKASYVDSERLVLADDIDDVHYVHTHPINGIADTYTNPQYKEARDHFNVVTPNEKNFRAQLELMRDGLIPMIKTPPGWNDLKDSAIRRYQLIEAANTAKENYVVAGPSGMWEIGVTHGNEGDSEMEKFINVYDKYLNPENESHGEKELDAERYMQLNFEVIGPYADQAVEAYLKGDTELLLRDVQEREKMLVEMKKIAKKWSFDIDYTSY